MSNLIDGRAIAAGLNQEPAGRVRLLRERGVVPHIVFVRVGEDPASKVYVGMKERTSAEVGLRSTTHVLPVATPQDELLRLLRDLNRDPAVHGILVQAPLPPPIDQAVVFATVDPEKDVDGFHPVNVGRLLLGDAGGFVPCTPGGVHELLIRSGVRTEGAEVVILGRGNIVGKPMAMLLLAAGATVTLCNSKTRDLAAQTRRADVLVAAVGRPGIITGDMVKPGAVVIDVGINRGADGKLCGDVDFASASEVASAITPVPGGVGPMTIAMLLVNTLEAAERSANISL